MKARRLGASVVLGLLLGSALATPASGLELQWQITMTPSSATAGTSTAFSFTATNLLVLQGIACVEVKVPDSFELVGYGTPSATSGAWTSYTVVDAGDTYVVAQASSSFAELGLLASVTFTVTARPTAAGSYQWENHVHRSLGCDDANDFGTPLTVSVSAASPTASPTPSPTATVRPSPTPTPSPLLPLPSLSLPSLGLASPTGTPTATPTTTPSPSGSPDPEAAGSGTPRASDAASPTPREQGRTDGANAPSAPPDAESPGVAGGPRQYRVAPDEATGSAIAGMAGAAVLGLGATWVIPGGAIGVSGLLIILWVAAQTFGAGVMTAAVRRWGRDSRT